MPLIGRSFVNVNWSYGHPTSKAWVRKLVQDGFDGIRLDAFCGATGDGNWADNPTSIDFNLDAGPRWSVVMDQLVADRKGLILVLNGGPKNNAAWQSATGMADPTIQAAGGARPADNRAWRHHANAVPVMGRVWKSVIDYCAGRYAAAGLSPSQYMAVQLGNEPYGAVDPTTDAGQWNLHCNRHCSDANYNLVTYTDAWGLTRIAAPMDGYMGALSPVTALATLGTWWGTSITNGILNLAAVAAPPTWFQYFEPSHHNYNSIHLGGRTGRREVADQMAQFFEVARAKIDTVAAWQGKPIHVTEYGGPPLWLGLYADGRGVVSSQLRSDDLWGACIVAIKDRLMSLNRGGTTALYRAYNDDASHDSDTTLQSGLILSTGVPTKAAAWIVRNYGRTRWDGGGGTPPPNPPFSGGAWRADVNSFTGPIGLS